MRCGAQCWLISRADNRQKKREGGQRGSGLMKKHRLSASWAEAAAATAATWCCLFCLPAACLIQLSVYQSHCLPILYSAIRLPFSVCSPPLLAWQRAVPKPALRVDACNYGKFLIAKLNQHKRQSCLSFRTLPAIISCPPFFLAPLFLHIPLPAPLYLLPCSSFQVEMQPGSKSSNL